MKEKSAVQAVTFIRGDADSASSGKSMLHSLLRRSLKSFVVKIAGTALGAAVSILLARTLTVAEFGAFSFVLSLVAVGVLPAKLGLDTAALRFVPQYLSGRDPDDREHLLRFLRLGAFVTVVGGSVLALLYYVLLQQFPVGDIAGRGALTLGLASVPILAYTQFGQAVLLGAKRPVYGQLPDPVLRPLIMIVSLGTLTYFGFALDSSAALGIYLFSVMGALFAARYWMKTALPATPETLLAMTDRRLEVSWLKIATPMFFISCCHIILSQTDILILGFYAQAEEVGLYSAAVRIALLCLFFLNVVQAFLGPQIAEYHAQQNAEALQRFVRLSANAVFFASVPLLFAVYCGREYVLLIFGPEFLPASGMLALLLCAQFFKIFAAPASYLVTMTGHERIALKIIGAGALVNLVLDLILIPIYGGAGAALATAIAAAGWNVAMAAFVGKKLGIRAFAH